MMLDKFVRRADGRVEQLCEHGIGHPLVGIVWKGKWEDWMGIHGCDGCCTQPEYIPVDEDVATLRFLISEYANEKDAELTSDAQKLKYDIIRVLNDAGWVRSKVKVRPLRGR